MNLHTTNRCLRCDYDLRGIDSSRCPECGASTTYIQVRVADPQQFHRARAALEHHGLLYRAIEPGAASGAISFINGFGNGILWVDSTQTERVEECLDCAGVISNFQTKPVVDRSEPICPACEKNLSESTGEVCPNCHTEFIWIDVESEPVDPDGHRCASCSYNLTGNTSGECPECGSSVRNSILASINPSADFTSTSAAPQISIQGRRVLGFALLFTSILSLATGRYDWASEHLTFVYVVSGTFVLSCFLLFMPAPSRRSSHE